MNMRKILFITLLLFASVSAFGQMVSSSSLVVTKTKKQLPEVKPGYEQSIDVAYTYFFNSSSSMGIDLNYIGGWRFNRMFYVGLGTGLYLNIYDNGERNPHSTSPFYRNLELPVVNIPLYAHGKVYFTQKRCMPFVGLSIGGTFSTPIKGEALYYVDVDNFYFLPFSYGTCRFLLNPTMGVDYRINADMDIYLSLGYRGMTQPEVTNLTPYSISVGQTFVGAIDLHIGFTF